MSKTILIADDEEASLKSIQTALRISGYKVVIAKDGNEAIQKIEEHKPDLLILDMLMPNLTGNEVCSNLRQRQDELSRTPVIILTALDPMLSEPKAVEAGAQKLLSKPVHPQDLLDTISELLGK